MGDVTLRKSKAALPERNGQQLAAKSAVHENTSRFAREGLCKAAAAASSAAKEAGPRRRPSSESTRCLVRRLSDVCSAGGSPRLVRQQRCPVYSRVRCMICSK